MESVQNTSRLNEHYIKGARLNLLTFILAFPLFAISMLPFMLIHGWSNTLREVLNLVSPGLILFLLLGVVLHEGIHALTWIILLKNGVNSIKFGFNKHSLSPYTHCKKPMKVWQYRLGGLMPGLLMGILPLVLSYFLQNTLLNFVGFLFLWAACGDFISLFLLRKLPSNSTVLDHPDEMGYIEVNDSIS